MDPNFPPDSRLRVSTEHLTQILAQLDDGIMVTDAQGVIVFYNDAMARIDSMDPAGVIGRTVTDVYESDGENSPTMRCVLQQKPVRRFSRFYLTRHGRAVSALQDVFPLFQDGEFTGAINFIREYSSIAREMDSASATHVPSPPVPSEGGTCQGIIGNTPELLQTIRTAQMAAASPSPVMIFGESGTGKELFAQALHNSSPWRDRPFVAVNC
ncbi:MAG: sigma 54-interacting transcriptional regulator, partial [Desulfobacterales bacterium]|nr:sigma 54-interacting transcriptional regulator [Desulfobacterales bacterium]